MQDDPNPPGIGARHIGVRHEAFDLREWVSFAWRHWKFIAAITAIVLVVGAAYLLNQTRSLYWRPPRFCSIRKRKGCRVATRSPPSRGSAFR